MKILSLLWKLTTVGMGIWGIYENMMVNEDWAAMFSYFTNISNVSVTLYSLITVILILLGSKLQHKLYFKFKGILLLCISITHIVFVVLVAPEFKKNPKLAVYMNHPANYLAHYVVPWLFILDYLLFDEKGHFKWYDSFIWDFVVLSYIPYAYLRVYVVGYFDRVAGTKYPYFFMDIDQFGVKGCALQIAGLIGQFLILAWIIILIDYSIAKLTNKLSKKSHKD